MRVCCEGCQTIIEVDDADVKAYVGRLTGSARSDKKTAANRLNAKRPRPGSLGNQRARKHFEEDC